MPQEVRLTQSGTQSPCQQGHLFLVGILKQTSILLAWLFLPLELQTRPPILPSLWRRPVALQCLQLPQSRPSRLFLLASLPDQVDTASEEE